MGGAGDAEDHTEDHEKIVTGMLERHRDGLLLALGDDGFRVPLPAVADLLEFRTVPAPSDRATMADLVVPSDAFTVIRTWERALARKVATDAVHLKSDPGHRVQLVIMDARSRYGVWLGVLGEPEDDHEAVETPLDESLLVPLRPRIGTIRKDWHAVITQVNEHAVGMLGWPADEMTGKRSLEFIHPDDQDRAVANWMEMLSHGQLKRIRLRHRRSDGTWLWVEAENSIVGTDPEGSPEIETRLSDISDEMAAHEEVRRRQEMFHRLAESLPTGIMQLDENGAVVYANSHLSAVLGVDDADPLPQGLRHLHPEDRARFEAAVATALVEGTDSTLEIGLRLPPAGEARRCTAAVVATTGPQGTSGAVVWIHDVTESTRLREELLHRATHDPLTGCLNRAAILTVLEQALAGADHEYTAAFFVDLNGFKRINDTLGHAAGDEVLVRVAHRLAGVCRDHDHLGRLGGDEFLLVRGHLHDPDEAAGVAGQIRAALRSPITVAAGPVSVGAGIGVAVGRNGTAADELVARADAAMYRAKRHREGRPAPAVDRRLRAAAGAVPRLPRQLGGASTSEKARGTADRNPGREPAREA